MTTLWIFGDSYGVGLKHLRNSKKITSFEDKDYHNNPWIWFYNLGKKLKCENTINLSMPGCSNDYIFHKLLENRHKITQTDYVIVVSTSVKRKWFLKNNPELSNFYTNNFMKLAGKEVSDAVGKYLLYLDNPILIDLDFHKTLMAIHYLTDYHDWNLIVIPGFEEKTFPISHRYRVTGSLFDVCMKEFQTKNEEDWFYKQYCYGADKRPGHISKRNHEILTDKLVDCLINGSLLDLTSGFFEKFITKDDIETYEKTELPTIEEDINV